MKPELQVCGFEQAKELFRLGVLQQSLYFYTFYSPKPEVSYLNPKKHAVSMYSHTLQKYGDDSFVEIRSAFTVSELALLLNITEGPINPITLADQLILQLTNHHPSIEEVNSRLLSTI